MHPLRIEPDERSAKRNEIPSLDLLTRLEAAHEHMFLCVRLMEGATRCVSPDIEQLTAARLKISQASFVGRALWHSVHGHLQPKVDQRDAETLRKLTEIDLQLFGQSSGHVSSWTVQAILADWGGYQVASKAIRARIIECIEAEQAALYPMLHRYH
jgi:hypothetical protein